MPSQYPVFSFPMSGNQEIVSFPFKPYLAVYLFYSIKHQVIETTEEYIKPLDIDLHSKDGMILRLLMDRVDYPIKEKVGKGFRLYVSVPKLSTQHLAVFKDARSGSLFVDSDMVTLINDLYDARFRDQFHAFVCGHVKGSSQKRGAIEAATAAFMEAYRLSDHGFTLESLVKYYNRYNSPLKTCVYEKRKPGRPRKKKSPPPKDLINKYVKNL